MQDISCEEAKTLIEKGGQLIDVRTVLEFQQGCLPGAKSVPLEVLAGALSKLEKDKPIVIYCRTGRRSHMAKTFLESAGFSSVHNLGSAQNYFGC